MKSLIIYYSEYKGNTEKIATKIAHKIDADLLNAKELDSKTIDIEKYSLIGFGSGVYRETMSHKLFRISEGLNLEGKNVFVFSTSGIGMKFYNNRLKEQLVSKGAIDKGDFACKGSFIASEFTDKKIFGFFGKLSHGHPDEEDVKRAEEFIVSLMNSI
ncbi:MAG: flavodoxin domain-containing protein [Bacillota bacterium]